MLVAARADEAVLPDGKRLPGELMTDGQGRLIFQRPGQQPPLPLARLHHVSFPPYRSPPLRAGAPYRVVLRDDQHLTGELLELGKDKVELRTAWCSALGIPRSAVVAVSQVPRFVTIFLDDFEKDLKSWRITGTPVLSTAQHVSGRHSLCFAGPGQAEHALAAPLAEGRVGISFCDDASATRLAWQIEADFAGSAGWPTVRVRLDPRAGEYRADVSGTSSAKGRLPRKAGWRRLDIEFNIDQLVLSIDGDILLSFRQPGSGGSLRKVGLSCAGLASTAGPSGELFFDDFSLAKTVPELTRPKGDPEQDEIWLVSGDQLFGKVVNAAEGKIQLHALFGGRAISWSDVRGIYFPLSGPLTRKLGQTSVRVWLRPGIGYEPDMLEGNVLLLDKRRLVLRHEILGELEIDRKRLHRLGLRAE
jgi:hypothetical protein